MLESYRLLQTVLFLTDSVFYVLFAYFDESMGVIGGMDHREVGIQYILHQYEFIMSSLQYLSGGFIFLY